MSDESIIFSNALYSNFYAAATLGNTAQDILITDKNTSWQKLQSRSNDIFMFMAKSMFLSRSRRQSCLRRCYLLNYQFPF